MSLSTSSVDRIRITGLDVCAVAIDASTFSLRFEEIINPLNANLFPKLSAMAAMFEKWRPVGFGFRFRYHATCPTTLSGVAASYVESDVADTDVPASIVGVMNEKYSSSSPVFSSHVVNYPPRDDMPRFYFTQADLSSELEGDRTAIAGIYRFYSSNAAAADSAKFEGFIAVEYDVELTTWRPPITEGFVLVNENDQALANAVQLNPLLAAPDDSLSLGARASRYLKDGFKPFINALAPVAASQEESRNLYLPLNKTTPVALTYSLGAHTPLTSSFELKEEKKEKAPGHKREVGVGDFIPYATREDETGAWWYQAVAGGEWSLVPSDEELKRRRGPLAVDDVTFKWYSLNQETGVFTTLASITINDPAAFAYSIAQAVTPLLPGWLVFGIEAVITGVRVLNAIRSVVGPAVRISSGSPPLVRNRIDRPVCWTSGESPYCFEHIEAPMEESKTVAPGPSTVLKVPSGRAVGKRD